jgi:heat shock protein 5
MIEDAKRFEEEDRIAKEKIDARNSLESYIFSMKNTIEDKEKLADKLEEDDKKTIKDALKDAQDWLSSNSDADKEEYEAQLKDLEK